MVIVPEALEEIDDLHRFYEEIRPGLGEKFIESLGDSFNDLLINPSRFQFVRTKKEGIRRGLLNRLPVVFLYREANYELRILMVRDTRTDWKK